MPITRSVIFSLAAWSLYMGDWPCSLDLQAPGGGRGEIVLPRRAVLAVVLPPPLFRQSSRSGEVENQARVTVAFWLNREVVTHRKQDSRPALLVEGYRNVTRGRESSHVGMCTGMHRVMPRPPASSRPPAARRPFSFVCAVPLAAHPPGWHRLHLGVCETPVIEDGPRAPQPTRVP